MTIKNFFISITAVCAMVLLMPLYVKAFYDAPNGESYKYKYSISVPFYQSTTYTADLYTNEKIAGYTGGSTSSNKRFYMLYNGTATKLQWNDSAPGTYDNINNSSWSNFNFTDVSGIVHPEFCLHVTSGTTGHVIGAALSDLNTDIPRYSDWNELVSYLNAIDADFENVIYDPMIPTPDFDVFYVEKTTNDSQFFPVVFSLNNNTPEYYIQVVMENLTPSSLGIGPVDTYTPYRFYQFPSHEIYTKESLTVASDVSNGVLNGSFSASWRSDILSYNESNVDITPNTPSWSTSNPNFILLREAWYNYRNIACFYGNNTGVSFRYFTIRDGVLYGSKVKSWTSLYGGVFSESIPDYYVPSDPAQGYENETINDIVPVETSNPSISFPSNQYGKKTGLNININIGSNVPNRPDYPTIATYNLDNMLVSTMNQGESIGGFLKGIAGFASSALAFIPDYVWQLVAFGLALSIVVMFLKIL